MVDRRMERHAPPPPSASADPEVPRRVAVVGGGIAGLTAATGLVERGIDVELIEREHYLGGRVGAWPEQLPDGTPVTMSRGFHAFFRQYYNLRGLLRRTDPHLDRLVGVDDYPLIDAFGRRDTFEGLPQRPPWNAIAFALRSPTFDWRDLLRLNAKAALPLARVEVPGTYDLLDDVDAASFLASINFPPAARHLAFEVFSRSFFARPEDLSAAELAVMFHLYFLGSSEGLLFDVPNDTFEAALWGPLATYLTDAGARLSLGTSIAAIEPGGDRRYRLHESSGAYRDVDAVVLATDLRGLQKLVAWSPGLGTPDWRDRIAALRSAPPFLVHRLWLDQPVATDRPAFLGTGGWGALDNVSVLNRYEREARAWADRHGGAVVELHAYAAEMGSAADSDALAKELEGLLHKVYPETQTATVVGTLSQWRDDCPLFSPGSFRDRPTVQTPDPQLVLAGDGIRIDLPVALMERAATTGWHAANLLLSRFGRRGHDLCTVPTTARIRALRLLKPSRDKEYER
ncbi:hydroxysqualene dehydroxylase [Kribbella deserti]|uniref:FAD-dependent oxidoreductase n=1 Tax=Kribbella deserti TaxID=1926257 RepID=A0ABV6QPJ3_9ACTN